MLDLEGVKKYVETVQRNAILDRLYKERRDACYHKDIENGIDPTFTFIDEDEN